MQVKSVRRGRKRREGRRKPSGDLVVVKLSREWSANQMPHRRGLPEDVRADERGESVLGRLRLRGLIEEGQYLAGARWRRVVGAFYATIGPPRGVCGNGRGGEIPQSECEDRKEEYLGALEAMWRDAGPGAVRVVNKIVLDDVKLEEGWLRYLRWGLTALERHFRPQGGGRDGGSIRVYTAPEIVAAIDT